MYKLMNVKTKKQRAMICLILALIFMLVISRIASSPKLYSATMSSLDEKKETVMALSASVAATSAVVSVASGGTMSSISKKLTDLTGYLLIILSIIYLEKYLLPILGFLIFGIFIPIMFILKGVDYYKDTKKIMGLVKKIIIIGLVVLLAIPISEKVSGLIHETYRTTIENTINMTEETITIEENEDGLFTAILSKIKDGATNTIDKLKSSLSNFVEAIAIMIVADCLIPIAVLIFCLWLAKGITAIPENDIKRITQND